MFEDSNVDFGAIQIHKEAIADIAASAISEVKGVSLITKSLTDSFLEFFKKKSYSGIRIQVDKDNQITIDLQIIVRYGMNIPLVGRQVQEAVRNAVEKLADVNLKDINVNICGMERGT